MLEVRDRVRSDAHQVGFELRVMELGPRRETFIEYTVECPCVATSLGPVAVRMRDAFSCSIARRNSTCTMTSLSSPRWKT